MDEQSSKLFRKLIYTSPVVVDDNYKQLATFDNVILAGRENPTSNSGFSFLILEKDDIGKVIFRGDTEEFQNASTIFLLRTKLELEDELEMEERENY